MRKASSRTTNATATFSKSSPGVFNVSEAINGPTTGNDGWAIYNNGLTQSQVAAFQTVNDVGFSGGTLLTFTLYQNYSNLGHLLGDFRLSITQADRSTFANGLQTGGNVGDPSIWTQLQPTSATSLNGATLTINSDNTILSSGLNPGTDTYTVTAVTSLTDITGVRLEVLNNPSLPNDGPGRMSNGNFVLTQFTMDASAFSVPEPATMLLLGIGAVGALGHAWRRQKQPVSG